MPTAVADRSTVIRRTMNADWLNAVANDPDVRPWLGGKDTIDLQPILDNPSNIALETKHGGFVVVCLEPGIYEVHSLFLPDGRGAEAHAAMRQGLRYLFAETDCVDLLTKVPADNPAAMSLAKAAGFSLRFMRPHCWPEFGGPTAVSFMGLDFWSWARSAPETAEAGEWFHVQLEAAKDASESDRPIHDDDDAHDRAVGAAVLMLRAGNAVKAVALYNRWARFALYAPITLLSAFPPVVDVVDAVVTLRDGHDMEVLQCR